METEILRRLDAQERLLHVLLAALAPTESDGASFDDLVETLSDLTVAVAEVTEAVRALRWTGSGQPQARTAG